MRHRREYYIKLIGDKIRKQTNEVPLNNININKNIKTDSWFDIKESDKYKFVNKLKFKKIIKNKSIIKCNKIILEPNKEQKITLLKWLKSVRIMYNKTINYIKNQYKTTNKCTFSFKTLRMILKTKKNKLINIYGTPTHIIDSGIKLASTSYKSAFTNYKNRNIRYFNIRYLKSTKKTNIMNIEQQYLNKTTICPTKLGKILLNRSNINYDKIKNDCTLHYCSDTDRFTLLIPEEIKCADKKHDNSFISIDPGVRTFLTCMSDDKKMEICTKGYNEINKYLNKIDNKQAIENKKKREERLKKLRKKLRNKITDLHWKSINYLINQNKHTIAIGNWSTKRCVSKKGSLNNRLKKVMMSLSYYKFLQKLDYKCKQQNINLKIVDESYTSILCSKCGKENKELGSSKKFDCKKCNFKHDRDMNACRNILIKSL